MTQFSPSPSWVPTGSGTTCVDYIFIAEVEYLERQIKYFEKLYPRGDIKGKRIPVWACFNLVLGLLWGHIAIIWELFWQFRPPRCARAFTSKFSESSVLRGKLHLFKSTKPSQGRELLKYSMHSIGLNSASSIIVPERTRETKVVELANISLRKY